MSIVHTTIGELPENRVPEQIISRAILIMVWTVRRRQTRVTIHLSSLPLYNETDSIYLTDRARRYKLADSQALSMAFKLSGWNHLLFERLWFNRNVQLEVEGKWKGQTRVSLWCEQKQVCYINTQNPLGLYIIYPIWTTDTVAAVLYMYQSKTVGLSGQCVYSILAKIKKGRPSLWRTCHYWVFRW